MKAQLAPVPRFAAALLALVWLLTPQLALAQAMTLGEVMCNAAYNVTPLGWLMNGIAYIAGAVLIGGGLLHLVRHTDNPREAKLHDSVARIVAGAALLALPSFIELTLNSIFNFSSGGGLTVCAAGAASAVSTAGYGTSSGYATGLDVLMTNLIQNIKDPMTFLLSAIAMTMGIFLVIRGLLKASRYGQDPRQNSIANVLANIVIGAILFVVGQSLGVMLGTLFGTSDVAGFSVINYGQLSGNFGTSTQPFQNAIYAALTFFQLIGFIAFIRGFLILKNSIEGSGQATLAQGITHILGGVAAVNIYYVLTIFDSTFGTNFLS